MNNGDDTLTFAIEAEGERAELVLPRALVDLFAAEDEESVDVIADVAMLTFAQRIYETVHLSEGKASAEQQELKTKTLALFEERFDSSFEDMTGYIVDKDDH